MAVNAESMKNFGMTADILSKAAKEVSGIYTSRLNVGDSRQKAVTLAQAQAARLIHKKP